MRVHGNWCGPGWTAGQFKNANEMNKKDKFVPAIDNLDQACKDHDIDVAEATNDNDLILANQKFAKEASKLGLKGKLFGTLVSNFGPTTKTSMARLRHREYDELTPGQEPPMAPNQGKRGREDSDDANDSNEAMTDADKPSNKIMKTESAITPFTTTQGGRKGAHETPVMDVPPTYGLQDTHTTTLPITLYFSQWGHDYTTPRRIIIRMNDINAIATGTPTVSPFPGANPIPQGTYMRKIRSGAAAASIGEFMNFPPGGTNNTNPAWFDYFKNIYQVYTVRACHMETTIFNVCTEETTALLAFQHQDNEGSSNNNNELPVAPLTECQQWEQMEWKPIYAANNDQAFKRDTVKFQYSWYPGKQKHAVLNDADVVTWTPVNGSPTIRFRNVIGLFNHDLLGNHTTVNNRCVMRVDLRYVVQFKDRVVHARYPHDNVGSTVVQTLPGDALSY
jgi:hypothetical protein